MTILRVGDRIIARYGKGVIIHKEKCCGTILYYVKHDNYNANFHSCGGMCEKGYGWKYIKDGIKVIFKSKALQMFID